MPIQPRQVSGTNVITGEVRLSYLNAFVPRASTDPNDADKTPRYGCAVLIPKGDTATLQLLKKALMDAGIAKWGEPKFRQMLEAKTLRLPIRDGDKERPDDAAYKGHYFFNTRSKNKPQIVDTQLNPITSPEGIRSGDYARVNVNAFGYETKGKGVTFGLNNIQLIRRGEPLAGGPDAVEVFDQIEREDAGLSDEGKGGDDFLDF